MGKKKKMFLRNYSKKLPELNTFLDNMRNHLNLNYQVLFLYKKYCYI